MKPNSNDNSNNKIQEIFSNSRGVSHKSREIFSKSTGMSHKSREIFSKSTGMSHKSREIFSNSTRVSHKSVEILESTPNRGISAPKNTTEKKFETTKNQDIRNPNYRQTVDISNSKIIHHTTESHFGTSQDFHNKEFSGSNHQVVQHFGTNKDFLQKNLLEFYPPEFVEQLLSAHIDDRKNNEAQSEQAKAELNTGIATLISTAMSAGGAAMLLTLPGLGVVGGMLLSGGIQSGYSAIRKAYNGEPVTQQAFFEEIASGFASGAISVGFSRLAATKAIPEGLKTITKILSSGASSATSQGVNNFYYQRPLTEGCGISFISGATSETVRLALNPVMDSCRPIPKSLEDRNFQNLTMKQHAQHIMQNALISSGEGVISSGTSMAIKNVGYGKAWTEGLLESAVHNFIVSCLDNASNGSIEACHINRAEQDAIKSRISYSLGGVFKNTGLSANQVILAEKVIAGMVNAGCVAGGTALLCYYPDGTLGLTLLQEGVTSGIQVVESFWNNTEVDLNGHLISVGIGIASGQLLTGKAANEGVKQMMVRFGSNAAKAGVASVVTKVATDASHGQLPNAKNTKEFASTFEQSFVSSVVGSAIAEIVQPLRAKIEDQCLQGNKQSIKRILDNENTVKKLAFTVAEKSISAASTTSLLTVGNNCYNERPLTEGLKTAIARSVASSIVSGLVVDSVRSYQEKQAAQTAIEHLKSTLADAKFDKQEFVDKFNEATNGELLQAALLEKIETDAVAVLGDKTIEALNSGAGTIAWDLLKDDLIYPVYDNTTQAWVAGAGNAAMMAGGLALIVFTGPAGGVVGGVLLSAGASGLVNAIEQGSNTEESFDWGAQLTEVGKGAAEGLVTAGAGAALSVAGKGILTGCKLVSTSTKVAAEVVKHSLSGAGTGAAGRVARNFMDGKPIGEGVLESVVSGAASGVLGVATGAAGQHFSKNLGKTTQQAVSSVSNAAGAAAGHAVSTAIQGGNFNDITGWTISVIPAAVIGAKPPCNKQPQKTKKNHAESSGVNADANKKVKSLNVRELNKAAGERDAKVRMITEVRKKTEKPAEISRGYVGTTNDRAPAFRGDAKDPVTGRPRAKSVGGDKSLREPTIFPESSAVDNVQPRRINVKRPDFRRKISLRKALIKKTVLKNINPKKPLDRQGINCCHRVSFADIVDNINAARESGSPRLAIALFESMPYKKGTVSHKKANQALRKFTSDLLKGERGESSGNELIAELNSCPEQLSFGNASRNQSIGRHVDPNVDQNSDGTYSATPITRDILERVHENEVYVTGPSVQNGELQFSHGPGGTFSWNQITPRTMGLLRSLSFRQMPALSLPQSILPQSQPVLRRTQSERIMSVRQQRPANEAKTPANEAKTTTLFLLQNKIL